MSMDGESYVVEGDTRPYEGQTTGKRIATPSATIKALRHGRAGVTVSLYESFPHSTIK